MLISQLKKILSSSYQNEFESVTLRNEFASLHGIHVGMYSYGCFDETRIDKNTHIGRYCSFSNTSRVMNRNHGVDYISTTPYLYNSNLGLVSSDTIIYEKCTFSDDVWVGHGAMILPSARYIGRGSVIGAGSVVTKDVEPYSIVAGNPARLIRMRFPPETIKYIESTSWWDWDIDELRKRAKKTPNLIFNPEGENR